MYIYIYIYNYIYIIIYIYIFIYNYIYIFIIKYINGFRHMLSNPHSNCNSIQWMVPYNILSTSCRSPNSVAWCKFQRIFPWFPCIIQVSYDFLQIFPSNSQSALLLLILARWMRNTKDQLEKTTYENDMNDYETTGKSHRTSKYSKSIYINLVVDDMLIPSEKKCYC